VDDDSDDEDVRKKPPKEVAPTEPIDTEATDHEQVAYCS